MGVQQVKTIKQQGKEQGPIWGKMRVPVAIRSLITYYDVQTLDPNS